MTNGLRYHDVVAGKDCSPLWTPEGLVRRVPLAPPFPVGGTGYVIAGAACIPFDGPDKLWTAGPIVRWETFPPLTEVNGRRPGEL